jgi:hypothetical protein
VRVGWQHHPSSSSPSHSPVQGSLQVSPSASFFISPHRSTANYMPPKAKRLKPYNHSFVCAHLIGPYVHPNRAVWVSQRNCHSSVTRAGRFSITHIWAVSRLSLDCLRDQLPLQYCTVSFLGPAKPTGDRTNESYYRSVPLPVFFTSLNSPFWSPLAPLLLH